MSRVGSSITRRTGRNGQITLTTNKKQLTRNVNNAKERTITAGRGYNLAVSKMDMNSGIEPGKCH